MKMAILIIGGTGFIGRRLIPLLANCGKEIACMDINPQTAIRRPRISPNTASRSASCGAMSTSSTMS
jgi:nucleoside-diphosphate-sugar epimerase